MNSFAILGSSHLVSCHSRTRSAGACDGAGSGVPHAHDGLTAGVELARQRRDRYSVPEPALDLPPPLLCETQGPAERLAFSFRSAQARLGALNQQVTLELRDGIKDVHGQL